MLETIGREQVQVLIHNGAQVVEVLGASQYEEAHLPHAINIPLAKLRPETVSVLNPKGAVIVYCHDLR